MEQPFECCKRCTEWYNHKEDDRIDAEPEDYCISMCISVKEAITAHKTECPQFFEKYTKQ